VIAYHMHILLGDDIYVFELQRWVDKLEDYLEKMAKKLQGKRELVDVKDRLPVKRKGK